MQPIPSWLSNTTESTLHYWFRTSMGLEDMVLAEIKEKLPILHAYQSHRNVLVAVDRNSDINLDAMALAVRCADDVYRCLGLCTGIDHTKAAVERLSVHFENRIAPALITHYNKRPWRFTLSFLGKRNFNRYFAENKLHESLQALAPIKILSNEQGEKWQPNELRIRYHLEEEVAFIGKSIHDSPLHRRPWRAQRYAAQLHTPIAASMARALTLSSTGQPHYIIDPFCGSGTLLIESALIHPNHPHLGYDISDEAIAIAQQSASQAISNNNIVFKQANSLNLSLKGQSYSIISNPPWGEKHLLHQDLLTSFLQLLQHSQQAILILPEPLLSKLQQAPELLVSPITQTRTRGKLAHIVQATPR